MSALPRPAVTGPARVLNDALHDLHHRAGWPSLRTLAKQTGVSHTTVSKVFSRPELPAWGTVELLVEAMGGDTQDLRELWLAASSPVGTGPTSASRMAGRRRELAAVVRHVEAGTGLLVVTGEAGMGKTTLIRAASSATTTYLATGHCRPLSMPIPLLPVVEVLRILMDADDGAWAADVLRSCPAWVGSALGPLLPELGPANPPDPGDLGRQRMMTALLSLLQTFASARPLALCFDDLPWADARTLDLVELLSSRETRVPVVATWRTDDPDTTDAHAQWWARVAERSQRVALVPLSREETTDQLSLLAGWDSASDRVDQIYRRSQGHPLFTEQLAAGGDADGGLPAALSGMLSRRLDTLTGEDWLIVRTLGIADRPLRAEHLTGATPGVVDPVPALRGLNRRRLVAIDGDEVRLRHPLLGEAVRAMLLPGEALEVHALVATVLADLADPPAAEIAEHWRAARRPSTELPWRIRAARAADARFAGPEAFAQWSRALELWDTDPTTDDEVTVDLWELLARRLDSAIRAGQDPEALRRVVSDALSRQAPGPGRAAVLLRAGDLECGFGEVEVGMSLIDEAVAIHGRHPPTVEAARALEVRANILTWLGRHGEARKDVDRGVTLSTILGAPEIERIFLAQSAWLHLVDGDLEQARALAWRASRAVRPEVDPGGTVRVGATVVEVLLWAGRPASEVAAAAADAADLADRWQLTGLGPDAIFALVCQSHLGAGDVDGAASWIEPRVAAAADDRLLRSRCMLAAVEVRKGRGDAAVARLTDVVATSRGDNYADGDSMQALVLADVLLWSDRAGEAILPLDRAVEAVATNDLSRGAARLLVLRARAEADLHSVGTVREREAAQRAVEQVRSACATDPFGPAAYGADVVAHAATWRAELGRIRGRDGVQTWNVAAAEWERLGRPHDAAYCRWRGAQAALRDGHGTAAHRLLHRAAAAAQTHVPLLERITRTAAGR